MQNREGLVSHAQNKRRRRTISVALYPETITELDRLAKQAHRSRSRLCARLLECAVRMAQYMEPPRI